MWEACDESIKNISLWQWVISLWGGYYGTGWGACVEGVGGPGLVRLFLELRIFLANTRRITFMIIYKITYYGIN